MARCSDVPVLDANYIKKIMDFSISIAKLQPDDEKNLARELGPNWKGDIIGELSDLTLRARAIKRPAATDTTATGSRRGPKAARMGAMGAMSGGGVCESVLQVLFRILLIFSFITAITYFMADQCAPGSLAALQEQGTILLSRMNPFGSFYPIKAPPSLAGGQICLIVNRMTSNFASILVDINRQKDIVGILTYIISYISTAAGQNIMEIVTGLGLTGFTYQKLRPKATPAEVAAAKEAKAVAKAAEEAAAMEAAKVAENETTAETNARVDKFRDAALKAAREAALDRGQSQVAMKFIANVVHNMEPISIWLASQICPIISLSMIGVASARAAVARVVTRVANLRLRRSTVPVPALVPEQSKKSTQTQKVALEEKLNDVSEDMLAHINSAVDAALAQALATQNVSLTRRSPLHNSRRPPSQSHRSTSSRRTHSLPTAATAAAVAAAVAAMATVVPPATKAGSLPKKAPSPVKSKSSPK